MLSNDEKDLINKRNLKKLEKIKIINRMLKNIRIGVVQGKNKKLENRNVWIMDVR